MTAGQNFDLTLGALFISNILGAILYGVVCVQVYQYYRSSSGSSDKLWLKIGIMAILILDTANFAGCMQATYIYAVRNFGTVTFTGPTLGLALHSILSEVINCLCRVIFTWRIWRLNSGFSRIFFMFTIILLSLFALASACYVTSLNIRFSVPFAKFHNYNSMSFASFASSAVADVIVCIVLCFNLHSNRTGIKRTDTLVNKLMIYSIQTGALACAALFSFIITFATMPDSLVWQGICMLLGRLYFNALMANLNARDALREMNSPLACVTSAASKSSGSYGQSASTTVNSTYKAPLTIAIESVTGRSRGDSFIGLADYRPYIDPESLTHYHYSTASAHGVAL